MKKLKQERVNEAIGVLFVLIGVFTTVALLFFHPSDHSFYTSHPNASYRNITGLVGAHWAHYLNFTFGLSAYVIPAIFLFWAACFFLQKVPHKKWVECAGIAISVVAVASIVSLLSGSEWKVKAGGVLGYFIARGLETYFGVVGGFILSVCCFALALLLATDFLLYPLFERLFARAKGATNRIGDLFGRLFKFGQAQEGRASTSIRSRPSLHLFVPPKVKKYTGGEQPNEKDATEGDGKKWVERKRTSTVEEEVVFENAVANIKSKKEKDTKDPLEPPEQVAAPALSARPDELSTVPDYKFPPVSLLRTATANIVVDEDALHRNSKILEETLRDFGLQVKVIEVEQGPVITRYELLPAPGVKVNQIVSLTDDLALALKSTSVRFLTPIPGKSALGIEIPNASTTTVFLKELLESPAYRKKNPTLPLLLGKDTSGSPLISDLADMPHLLIAGVTGSGKTVCLNAVIAGLLYTKSPEHLRFIMVDPKMVELSIYKEIPHLLAPVVTDAKKAAATLNWLVGEMERRFRIFARVGTRNIQAFNDRLVRDTSGEHEEEEKAPKKLPYIVLVIDELADLMMVSRDRVEHAITRLAQLSRAVGIHLILATQRPSVDVITGVIKANFPARISFKVSSKVDSRTVLDMNGADQLIGKGDMLFLEPGVSKPTRGQATYITDGEILSIVEFIKSQKNAQYLPEVAAVLDYKASGMTADRDELYEDAVRVVLETRQASVSVLQRKLRLGYGRAARMIDTMEAEGIVGPHQGSKPRDILIERMDEVTGQPTES